LPAATPTIAWTSPNWPSCSTSPTRTAFAPGSTRHSAIAILSCQFGRSTQPVQTQRAPCSSANASTDAASARTTRPTGTTHSSYAGWSPISCSTFSARVNGTPAVIQSRAWTPDRFSKAIAAIRSGAFAGTSGRSPPTTSGRGGAVCADGSIGAPSSSGSRISASGGSSTPGSSAGSCAATWTVHADTSAAHTATRLDRRLMTSL
jgi:hypothetical protein